MQFPRRSTTVATIALVALTWLGLADARAQDFPSRVIRVVVAFPAGGPTDFVARLLADKLKPLLGQNVIVENRPGANGAIGADYVAKGEADGHLLFLTTVGAVAITPHLSKPNYDTLRDFAPVTLVVRPTTILVVKPDTPVNSAKELAALARDKPGAIPFASTGSGSTTHLALELYQSAANVNRVSPTPSPTTGTACWRPPRRRPPWWRNCTTRSLPCSIRPTCARSSSSPAPRPRRPRARSSGRS
jgi:tripartite-type tricarboxylate transporter receptor subunit TctC